MALAHDKNGLVGPNISPWHIRGTYRSFDRKGKLDYEGTYEEWWISDAKLKLSFTNPKFKQTDYANGAVLLRDGSQEWPAGYELLLRASLLEPLPDASQLKGFTLQHLSRAAGKDSIDCVALTYPLRPNLNVSGDYYPTACFDPVIPVLRLYSSGPSSRITYDRLVSFQGHYLARQIQVLFNGKPAADITIDVVEPLREPPDTVLTVPPTALAVSLTKIVFKGETTSRWPAALKKAAPVYPENAKSMHIQGTVNVKATIGPDGQADDVQLIDGPPMLRQAALDAVRQWLYRPFNVMGQARPVEVEIHVIFTLG
jgi:TonB family protein